MGPIIPREEGGGAFVSVWLCKNGYTVQSMEYRDNLREEGPRGWIVDIETMGME